jgi:glycosyltransferase involved in cell wall biosynthesis
VPASEHIVPSDDVLSRYHVLDKGFFFMLGSLDPNKNLAWLVKEAQRNPQETFLVSGSIDRKVFAKSAAMASLPSNVTFLGYASDEDVKGLMTHCKALVFPSFYEGFGVPPWKRCESELPSSFQISRYSVKSTKTPPSTLIPIGRITFGGSSRHQYNRGGQGTGFV